MNSATNTGEAMTSTTIEDARIAQMIRELQWDMAALVESGDLTDEQANEWVNHKADQWANGRS